MVAETDFVLSVTDVAVSVTVFPLGTALGAVYVVAVPLAVCVVATEPHEDPPQVTVHFTLGLAAESLLTFAVILVVVLIVIGLGGGGARDTEMGGGIIVIVAVAVFEVSVTEVAVIVTALLFPPGIARGAR
jgi:hypothetical protein